MEDDILIKKAGNYLHFLCSVKPNRRTGSAGNREATKFFADTISDFGFEIDVEPFDCLDHADGGSKLRLWDAEYQLFTSPYSLGCDVHRDIVAVSSFDELAGSVCQDKILLMHGPICGEQLMPKNFVFYNPEHHQQTIAMLERKNPAAIITATKRNPELVGALYPFPLINDGDFHIPAAFCTEVEGERILGSLPGTFHLTIDSRRIESWAYNIIARKNPAAQSKVVITAHIDVYGDTPGACDNGAGTVVLLLLAEMLGDYEGHLGIEIAAFNGEDHYSAGGQMDYLARYGHAFSEIALVINVDDAGYYRGKSAYSTYGLPSEMEKLADTVFGDYPGIIPGEPWFNGDHMIFVQSQVPAMAMAAERMTEFMATAAHTLADTPDIVDPEKLVEIAQALRSFILRLQ